MTGPQGPAGATGPTGAAAPGTAWVDADGVYVAPGDSWETLSYLTQQGAAEVLATQVVVDYIDDGGYIWQVNANTGAVYGTFVSGNPVNAVSGFTLGTVTGVCAGLQLEAGVQEYIVGGSSWIIPLPRYAFLGGDGMYHVVADNAGFSHVSVAVTWTSASGCGAAPSGSIGTVPVSAAIWIGNNPLAPPANFHGPLHRQIWTQ